MSNILDLLYDMPSEWCNTTHSDEPKFVKSARIRNEYMELLVSELDNEQEELFNCYLEAEGNVSALMDYSKFIHGFHLGAQLMKIINEGEKVFAE